MTRMSFGSFYYLFAIITFLISVPGKATLYQFEDSNGKSYLVDSIGLVNSIETFKKARNRLVSNEAATPYDKYIEAASRKYFLDPSLIRAVIKTESNFNRHAVSRKGAVGLMQLMPQTAKKYGARNLHDPAQNIMAGTAYLRDLINRFQGDLHLALAAYNAGETAVDKYNGIPPFRETEDYVVKVRDSRDYFKYARYFRKWVKYD